MNRLPHGQGVFEPAVPARRWNDNDAVMCRHGTPIRFKLYFGTDSTSAASQVLKHLASEKCLLRYRNGYRCMGKNGRIEEELKAKFPQTIMSSNLTIFNSPLSYFCCLSLVPDSRKHILRSTHKIMLKNLLITAQSDAKSETQCRGARVLNPFFSQR